MKGNAEYLWENNKVKELYLEALNELKFNLGRDVNLRLNEIGKAYDVLLKTTSINPSGTMYMEGCYQLAVTMRKQVAVGFNTKTNPRQLFEQNKAWIKSWIERNLVDFDGLEFHLFWED